jgi:hypothetical protein
LLRISRRKDCEISRKKTKKKGCSHLLTSADKTRTVYKHERIVQYFLAATASRRGDEDAVISQIVTGEILLGLIFIKSKEF